MQFDYEVEADEYAAAQTLYYRARNKGRHVKRGVGRVLVGLFLVLVAGARNWVVDWAAFLLLLNGSWFLYEAITILFPTSYYGSFYPESEKAGKKYHAEMDEEGFSVAGDSCTWRVLWTEVRLKSEDKLVFMFSAKNSLFIFGKKYLADEQQRDLRQFAAMP